MVKTQDWVSGPWPPGAVACALGRIRTFLPLLGYFLPPGVGLTVSMEQADMLASRGTPGLCLSATRNGVTFPRQRANT